MTAPFTLSDSIDSQITPSLESFGSVVPEKIALTGASKTLMGLLIQKITEWPNVKEIHVVDLRPPKVRSSKIGCQRTDLLKDGADRAMSQLLQKNEIKHFIHGALYSGPSRKAFYQKEVETIGTFHVLNAIAEAQVTQFLVLSDTFVYGAAESNPNFLTEKSPLRASSRSPFFRGRLDVEKQVSEFMKYYPTINTSVLRFSPTLGPNSTQVRAHYFLMGAIPKIVGYDPLLQFIHEMDATRAITKALISQARGVFNIVGAGVLPLTTAIHMSGKLAVPVPSPLCYGVFKSAFALQLWDFASDWIPFFKYICVADGSKAKKEMDFEAKFSSRQALRAFLDSYALKQSGFVYPSVAFGEDVVMIKDQKFERIY